jgi:hypothetical protein
MAWKAKNGPVTTVPIPTLKVKNNPRSELTLISGIFYYIIKTGNYSIENFAEKNSGRHGMSESGTIPDSLIPDYYFQSKVASTR